MKSTLIKRIARISLVIITLFFALFWQLNVHAVESPDESPNVPTTRSSEKNEIINGEVTLYSSQITALNLRSGPGLNYKVIEVLPIATHFYNVIKTPGSDWIYVTVLGTKADISDTGIPSSNNLQGYVQEDLLTKIVCKIPSNLTLESFSTTNYSFNLNSGRLQNIERSTELLNNWKISSNSISSVGTRMSPYSIKNGYAYGPAYSGQNTFSSLGGGICQLSSGVLDAILDLDYITITEHYFHPKSVPYVAYPKRDATIWLPGKDLKFKSEKDIIIFTFIDDYNVTILICSSI